MAAPEPRIAGLVRCGDLLAREPVQFCLTARGLSDAPLQVFVGDQPVADTRIRRDGERLRIDFGRDDRRGAPLWLEQDGRRSNPVWLTAGDAHVLAAGPEGIARNDDGIETYRNLVGVVIEERYDGLEEARNLAREYGAEVVGAIPPLNTYQLRLPARDLIERDALVLRIGNEVTVDAVVVEDSSAEPAEGGERPHAPQEGEWAANRFLDAVAYYRHRIPAQRDPVPTEPVRIGLIERDLDFDLPAFRRYLGPCERARDHGCLYARDAAEPDSHGTLVAGILMADDRSTPGFLAALKPAGAGFEVIVDRNSDAGITANVAASVNLVEDGVRILNWSWGIHRVGMRDVEGDPVDSLIRSGVAMSGYEELLEEFFLWLRREHPQVLVVNSAGNGSTFSSADDYRLPSSFVTEQLLVVGGHERSERHDLPVDHPDYSVRRRSSNLDTRVDIAAAACLHAWTPTGEPGAPHCGTSYATPMVAGVVAAMASINPSLSPEQLRELLRRSALTIGRDSDFEAADADDLTAPILPSERGYQLDDRDVGRSARLDMRQALELTVRSRDRAR
ncbi:S8/S53 family peptidase [Stutzerimonas azotifigens]|uniref:S8/S53 family peptidase n=1 Tax=Stutzerimonas azotifigens TaxID=291995 RepID=UPI0006883D41|nr:S8/S53 family peptidase [Stutzerimonas azotifigens]